jgi:hypothetical protein
MLQRVRSRRRNIVVERGPVPEVGIHPNVPFEQYAAWDALNHSALKHIDDSPKHYKHNRDNPESYSSDALRFGTLIHTLLLEPDRFEHITAPAPINEKTGKPYGMETKAWAEYAAALPGKLLVGEEELDRLDRMAEAIRKHKDSKVLFEHPSQREVCIVWDCPVTGLRCKGRVDLLIHLAGKSYLRTDLKSCTSAHPDRDLSKSLTSFGYNTQDAFYALGMEAMGLDSTGTIVAVENHGAHDVVVYGINEETRKASRVQVLDWLGKLRRSLETNEWPGYAESFIEIGASEWYLKLWAA